MWTSLVLVAVGVVVASAADLNEIRECLVIMADRTRLLIYEN